MVLVLSYLLAVILTVALAIVLYPIAAVFWILGLFGKISDKMFKFTKKAISRLWKDLKESKNPEKEEEKQTDTIEWVCDCGSKNNGNFCATCGKPKPVADVVITPPQE